MKKYVFITGAPGSAWGRIEAQIRKSTDVVDSTNFQPYLQDNIDNSTNHIHKFYGPYQQHGERFDVMHLMGPDAVMEEIDKSFDPSDIRPIRFVRCHWFAYQLDWIKEHLPQVDIISVFRESQMSYDWWHQSGGWSITYPNYKWYATSENMMRQIKVENDCILKFMFENKLKMTDNTWDLDKWFQNQWPELESYVKPNMDWPSIKNPAQDYTVWPVRYEGKESPTIKECINVQPS